MMFREFLSTKKIREFLSTKKIKELIELLEESDIDELEVGSFGRKIKIRKSTPTSCQKLSVQTISEKENELPKLVPIKSPMVGTIHLEPPPDSELPEHKFEPVKVGQRIQKGQTVCLIEAMKIPNEIASEVAGLVVKILVENNKPVQFGQPLFLINPQ